MGRRQPDGRRQPVLRRMLAATTEALKDTLRCMTPGSLNEQNYKPLIISTSDQTAEKHFSSENVDTDL